MPKLSLRRYDVQARVSVILSLASVLFMAATAFLILWHNVHTIVSEKVIPYRANSLRAPLIYVSGLAALGLGIAGFGLGLNSAGQRRNDKPTHSWIGFFLGAGAVSLSLILLYLFRSWGFAMPVE